MSYSFDQVRERAEIELVKKRKVCGCLHVCLCEWYTVGMLFNNGVLLCVCAVPLYDWSDLRVACIRVFTLNSVLFLFLFPFWAHSLSHSFPPPSQRVEHGDSSHLLHEAAE